MTTLAYESTRTPNLNRITLLDCTAHSHIPHTCHLRIDFTLLHIPSLHSDPLSIHITLHHIRISGISLLRHSLLIFSSATFLRSSQQKQGKVLRTHFISICSFFFHLDCCYAFYCRWSSEDDARLSCCALSETTLKPEPLS